MSYTFDMPKSPQFTFSNSTLSLGELAGSISNERLLIRNSSVRSLGNSRTPRYRIVRVLSSETRCRQRSVRNRKHIVPAFLLTSRTAVGKILRIFDHPFVEPFSQQLGKRTEFSHVCRHPFLAITGKRLGISELFKAGVGNLWHAVQSSVALCASLQICQLLSGWKLIHL
ncbi:hypothetical protein TNCV_2305361 [Trichonephila clavipes]|nr:hypothetical protein TNCV_2305361 [Trichonephila clavipes]